MTDQQGDGWLADPSGRHQLRYRTAGAWTDHVSDDGVAGTDPMPVAAPSAPPPGPSAPVAPAYAPGPPGPAQPPGPGTYPVGPPAAYPAGSGYGPPPTEAKARPIIGFVLTMVGVVLTFVGAVLPWVKISGLFSTSTAGTEGDGVLTIIIGVIVALLGVAMLLTRAGGIGIGVAIGAVLIGGIAIYDTANINSKAKGLDLGADLLQAEVGIGLWVTIAAAVVLLLGGIAGLARK